MELTKGATISVKRGRVNKRAFVLDVFQAGGVSWVEYSFISHTDGGSVVIAAKRHYDRADRVVVL